MKNIINKLIEGKNLIQQESENLIRGMIDGSLTPIQMSSILTALRIKGETVEEILGFINVLRREMVKVNVNDVVIDTCGTGGDSLGTFNISTAVSLVVSGCRVKVAKHGNRSVSSLCGSADLLEAIGVNINLKPTEAKEILEKIGLVFLFAPLFHPAFKNIIPVRRELGVRTVFNYLGPFINPAGVKRQIIGVPSLLMAEKLAKVAAKLNYEHLLIVSTDEGLDEISISSETHCFEIKKDKIRKFKILVEDHGIKRVSLDAIKGGDPSVNAKIIQEILSGKKGPIRDIVVLNSAYALLVAGRVSDIKTGLKLAKKSIDQGYGKAALDKLIIASNKYVKKHTG